MALAQAAAFTAPRVSSHPLCMRPGLWACHLGNALFQAAGLTFRFGGARSHRRSTAASGGGQSVIVALRGTPVHPRTC